MDYVIKPLINKQEAKLTGLMNKAIGNEFKEVAAQAINLIQQSGAIYSRLQRTYTVSLNEKDHKRVKASGLSTSGVQPTGSGNADAVLRSYEQAKIKGSKSLPATVSRTAVDTAVAANQPQVTILLALLHSTILKNDFLSSWDKINTAATQLGVMTTTASFVFSGGASLAYNYIAAAATGTGGILSLNPNAPDFTIEAIRNFITCLAAWNKKACTLINIADPKGQWSFHDFH